MDICLTVERIKYDGDEEQDLELSILFNKQTVIDVLNLLLLEVIVGLVFVVENEQKVKEKS